MANSLVRLPLPYVGDFNKGRPLFNAKLYIGEPDLDPEIPANQKTVTGRQEDGTLVTMLQPIRTSSGGYPIYNSAPIELLVDGAYSLKVLDKNDNQTYYFANVEDGAPVTFDDKPVLYRDTVAEAKADVDLTVGMYVTTKGYNSPNDGGGANYIVVAGGTGVDDGGSYHDMANGNQLELTMECAVKLAVFGAKEGATETTSQGPAIQNAINYANLKNLPIEDGGTFVMLDQDELTIGSGTIIKGDNLVLDYSGNASYINNLVITDSTVSGTFMHGSGSQGADFAITSGATLGSDTIVSAITGITAGDLVKVHSDDLSPGDATPAKIGEMSLVESVSGSTIVLQTPLHETYSTNPRVQKITPIENVRITGLTFIGKGRDDTMRGDLGLYIVRGKDCHIDCNFKSVDQVSCDFVSCFNFSQRGTAYHDDPKLGTNGFVQYQFRASSGSMYGDVDVVGFGSRHTFNTGFSTQIDGGINRHIDVKVKSTGTWHAAVSTHNAASDIFFRDINANGCLFAVNPREQNIRIGSVYAENCGNAILVTILPETIFCENLYVLNAGNGFLVTSLNATANVKNISIGKALFENCSQNGISLSAVGAANRTKFSVGELQVINSSSDGGNFASIRFEGEVDARLNKVEIIGSQNLGVRSAETATIQINDLYAESVASSLFSFGSNASPMLIDDLKDKDIIDLEIGAGTELLKIGRRFTL